MFLKQKKPFGILLFIWFLIFSSLVYSNLFSSFNTQTLLFLQLFIPRSLDFLFSLLSLIGTFEIVTLILLSILFFFKKVNKLFVLLGYFLVSVIGILSKSIIPQVAPPIELNRTEFFFSFPTGEVSEAFYAYPSGHVARTAFISAFLLFVIFRNTKLSKELKFTLAFFILTFDLIMFVSRAYLAEHWTTDVIGGILLGASVALILRKKTFSV